MRARDATGDAGVELAAELLERGEQVRVRARGNSMGPLVRDGDVLLLARLVDPPREGELVAAFAAGRLLIHRVVRVRDGAVMLQGDALWSADGWFALDRAGPARADDPTHVRSGGSRLIGRAIAISRDGRPLGAFRLSGPLARRWLLVLPLVRLVRGVLRKLSRAEPDGIRRRWPISRSR